MQTSGPNGTKRRTRLLIDCITSASPGVSHLQRELPLAAAMSCPVDCEVMVMRSAAQATADAVHERLSYVDPGHRITGWRRRWRWYHRDLPTLIDRYQADVFFSQSGILSAAIAARCPTISTVNNMLPFFPKEMDDLPILSRHRWRNLLLRQQYTRSVQLADALLLHSHLALAKISDYAGDVAQKSLVTHTGKPAMVAFDAKSPHPHAGKPYILYLSAMYWYKNHLALIAAYDLQLTRGVALPDLLLAGIPHDKWYMNRVLKAIDTPRLRDHVKYIGALPARDIGAWIHHATINVFPSRCETNSFVLAETLGVHGVLACSQTPPMPEICGDAAVYFDPLDPAAMGDTISSLLRDETLRRELRQRAAKRAEDFSWEACGRTIWALVPIALANFHRNGKVARLGSTPDDLAAASAHPAEGRR